jgi:hexosaminidase
VDTGRDFHSVDFIKKTIETMAMNKLSVLHWHIIEIDSFPLELEAFPELAQKAGFASNQVYSKQDVAEVVEFARSCGVRVMPEVEMPGHMSAYNLGLPQLNLTIDTGPRHNVDDFGIANLASPHLIPTMSAIVAEVAGMFDDELYFFGGDETACPYARYRFELLSCCSLAPLQP